MCNQMTSKDALVRQELKLLKDDIKGSDVVEVSPMVPHIGLNKLDAKKHLLEHIKTIERLLTPPTPAEVCRALSKELYGTPVKYIEGNREFILVINKKDSASITEVHGKRYEVIGCYTATTLALISHFYEGLEQA